eukprot:CAMPEP_0184021492 /NCGR_PEP_ID=MMETSP0954-20121128/9964_1 /TAXON_ID=627963 /ORGANISM="Aplanochytrium sp, Strain PBS07" /LENGTH=148 /DNA_ID=CAMNT_0026303529 /DNA_START=48 /DNA_END=491 /DNA_ORIENTATION=-
MQKTIFTFAAIIVATLNSVQADNLNLCAESANDHLLVNVNRLGQPMVNWVVPENNRFKVTISKDFQWVKLTGTVVPEGYDPDLYYMDISYTLSDLLTSEDCFCASNYFQKSPFSPGGSKRWPNLEATQEYCTGSLVNDESLNPKGLEW